jgi:hypothetical protein
VVRWWHSYLLHMTDGGGIWGDRSGALWV